MLIANPIYDVVFKYMMDDNKVAKLFLSAIIGEEIVELEFRPTEQRIQVGTPAIQIYRLDFAVKIRTPDGGEKLALIEIQKAKLATDIMRFRRYLGAQYADENNCVVTTKEDGKEEKSGLHFVAIYFLGHWLDHAKAPVIKVSRQSHDLSTGKLIVQKEAFIESLTHDAFIIQIPALKGKRQTELLQLLSVFDQENAESNHHILNISEEEFPEKYREVFRRLQKACAEKQVRDTMDAEDDILEAFKMHERSMARMLEQKIGEVVLLKDKELEQKDKELEQKDKELGEKDRELARLEKLLGL